MQPEPPLAFATESAHDAGLEIRVNFGVFAGREVTPAEIDELGRMLLPELNRVTIVAEQRHELSEDVEVALHQVRLEVAPEQVPVDAGERESLSERLVAKAELWAQACIDDRHADIAEP